jgi:hypothetical protein
MMWLRALQNEMGKEELAGHPDHFNSIDGAYSPLLLERAPSRWAEALHLLSFCCLAAP